MAVTNYATMLSEGAQYGSFQEKVSKSPYTTSLGTEIAILQRQVYLPLLPLERPGYGVFKAYDYLAENEMLGESEFHPQGYWFAEDVYADFYEGNFSISMLFPQLDMAGEEIRDAESTLVKYEAPSVNFKGGELATDGHMVKGNYIKLLIPKYIALQFRSTIPKNTEFIVNFTGGNSQVDQISIVGIKSVGEYDDPWLDNGRYKQTYYPGLFEEEEQVQELADIIKNNLDEIENEETRRKEECDGFAEYEAEFFGGGEEA